MRPVSNKSHAGPRLRDRHRPPPVGQQPLLVLDLVARVVDVAEVGGGPLDW